MATPTIRGWAAATNVVDMAPAFAVTLPTRAAGDLLIAFVGCDTITTAITRTQTTEWLQISEEAGANGRLAIFARIATNDANDNLSVAGPNNQDGSCNIVAITAGTHGVTNPATQLVAAAAATGASGNADPPSVDGLTAKDWLAFAIAVVDLTATGSSITAAPTNHTTNAILQKSASSTSSVALGVGPRALTATQTTDPGTFTNTSGAWIAKTLLVPGLAFGSVSGAISWGAGSVTGAKTPKGDVSGAVAWGAGTVDGIAPAGGGGGPATLVAGNYAFVSQNTPGTDATLTLPNDVVTGNKIVVTYVTRSDIFNGISCPRVTTWNLVGGPVTGVQDVADARCFVGEVTSDGSAVITFDHTTSGDSNDWMSAWASEAENAEFHDVEIAEFRATSYTQSSSTAAMTGDGGLGIGVVHHNGGGAASLVSPTEIAEFNTNMDIAFGTTVLDDTETFAAQASCDNAFWSNFLFSIALKSSGGAPAGPSEGTVSGAIGWAGSVTGEAPGSVESPITLYLPFTGTNGDPPGSPWTVDNGTINKQGNRVRLNPAASAFAVANMHTTGVDIADVKVEGEFSFNTIVNAGWPNLVLRSDGTWSGGNPNNGIAFYFGVEEGSYAIQVFVGGSNVQSLGPTSWTPVVGVPFRFTCELIEVGGVTHARSKIWRADNFGAEPEDWGVSGTLNHASRRASGGIGITYVRNTVTTSYHEYDEFIIQDLSNTRRKLLAIGDSTTAGPWNFPGNPATWRKYVYEYFDGTADPFQMVGQNWSPGTVDGSGGKINYAGHGAWDPDHYARNSWTIDQIVGTNRLENEALRYQPDIAVVYAGTNDVLNAVATSTIMEDLSTLIAELRAGKSDIKIVMCNLPPVPDAPGTGVVDFNTALVTLVADEDDPGSPVTLADLNTDFNETWIYDDIHFDDNGDQFVADAIIEAIESFDLVQGEVSGSISWVGSVTGARDSQGSISGATGWVGSVDGERSPVGSVSGSVTIGAGQVTGAKSPAGSVSGAIAWGAGVVVGGNLGVVVGAISWGEGSITGEKNPEGSLSGAVAWGAGTVDGVAPSVGVNDGEVSGAISWGAGEVTGQKTSQGSVDGTISWGAGVVVGGNLGVVVGAVGWGPGSVTGEREPKGDISGAISWAGSVDGETPAVGVNDGSVNGSISWVGSITGARSSEGAVSGAISWGNGVVVGGNLGVVIGAIMWSGTVTGEAPAIDSNEGSVSGAISWGAGAVTGKTEKRGGVAGAITWIGIVTAAYTIDPAVFLLAPNVSGYIRRVVRNHRARILKGRDKR